MQVTELLSIITGRPGGQAAVLVTSEAEAAAAAQALSDLHAAPRDALFLQPSAPIFHLSSVSGLGLCTLHAFLRNLQSAAALRRGTAAASSSQASQDSGARGESSTAGDWGMRENIVASSNQNVMITLASSCRSVCIPYHPYILGVLC